jgi:uncharacterized protein YecA (UPF0149 family)
MQDIPLIPRPAPKPCACGKPGYKTTGTGKLVCIKCYRRLYAQGPMIRNLEPRQGRNDPCACGSGLKFKRCCLHKDV